MNAIAQRQQTDLSPAARQKARLEAFMGQVASRAEQFSTLLADSKIDPKLFLETCRRAIMRDTDILDADPASFIQSALNCAGDGLIPDGRKAAFVRYYDKRAGKSIVQYIPMYQGLLDVAYRSGNFKSIEAQVVYKGDEFDFALGDDPYIKHRRSLEADTSEIIGAYAVAKTVNGGVFREVVGKKDLAQIRAVSRAKNGPNVDWPGEMARKGALRRQWKFLPRTPAMDRVIQNDDANYEALPAAEPAQHRLHAGFDQPALTDERSAAIDVTPTTVTEREPELEPTFSEEEVEAGAQAAAVAEDDDFLGDKPTTTAEPEKAATDRASPIIEGMRTGRDLLNDQQAAAALEELPERALKAWTALMDAMDAADSMDGLDEVWKGAGELRAQLAVHAPNRLKALQAHYNGRLEALS